MLYTILQSISVHNWYCGEVTALYAYTHGCTIESRNEQNKIRKALKEAGYIAHFGSGILSIEMI